MRRGLSPNLQIDAAVDGAHRLRHRRLARRVASSSDELHPAARRCELLAQRIELPAGELPVSLRRGLAKLVGHDASAVREVSGLLARRWAVVASDYPGLGTPGIHTYLIGQADATAVIPFNRPYLAGRESELVAEVMRSRRWSGDGPMTERAISLGASYVRKPDLRRVVNLVGALSAAPTPPEAA